jgi:hypothetical protein
VVFGFEVPKRECHENLRNFKSTTLVTDGRHYQAATSLRRAAFGRIVPKLRDEKPRCFASSKFMPARKHMMVKCISHAKPQAMIVGLVFAAMIALPAAAAESAIPDFSGLWARPYIGFEPPASGPGPIVNRSRVLGQSNINQFVGDYTSPILKPQAAEIVKKHGELELKGLVAHNPSNQCLPMSPPYILQRQQIQMLQQKNQITILYNEDQQVRRVRLNAQHPARVTLSWMGDSVGHYEGDTLVIDTVGIKTGPYTMVDQFGTPHTQALHVIERYRLIDYEAAKQALERGAKENANMIGNDSGVVTDLNDKGKHMQLEITVEDPGAFTTPWSATVIYRPGVSAYGASSDFPEAVCAENPNELARQPAVPIADKPDF